MIGRHARSFTHTGRTLTILLALFLLGLAGMVIGRG